MNKERGDGGEYVETTTTKAVLTAMRDASAPFVTVSDIADATDCSPETARRKLTDLHSDDRVKRRTVGASAVVWWVPDTRQLASINRRHGDEPDWGDLPDIGDAA